MHVYLFDFFYYSSPVKLYVPKLFQNFCVSGFQNCFKIIVFPGIYFGDKLYYFKTVCKIKTYRIFKDFKFDTLLVKD